MTDSPAAVAERPRSAEAGPDLERLKFRFGFLCLRAGFSYPAGPRQVLPKAEWSYERAGPFLIHLHPETRLARLSAGERHLLLLGDVYDFATGAPPDLAMLLAADEAGFLDAVDRLGGRFALLLVEGDRLRALNDAIGSRSLFYHAGEPFCLASHAPLVARTVRAGRRADVAALIEHPAFRARKVKYLPGDWTLYEDVFGLVPNNLYDSTAAGARRYWPRTPLRPTTFEGFLAAATEYLRAQAAFVGTQYTPLFGLTGGVDTRSVFASFRAFGVPFETFTWLDFPLAKGERKIIKDLASYLRVPHRNIRNPRKADAVARIGARNGGSIRDPAGKTSAMLRAYDRTQARVFVRCWGGEIMRGFYNTSWQPMRSLTPREMARAWGLGSTGGKGSYRSTVLGAFEQFFARGNYRDLKGLGYDPNDIFYWEHRMGMWGGNANNELDPAMTTLIGMNGRPMFLAAFGLPPKRRLTKQLLLDLTAHFDPGLARMEIVSSTRRKPSRLLTWRGSSALLRRIRRRLGI